MKKEKIISLMLTLSCAVYIIFVVWNILFKYVSPVALFSGGRYYSRSLNLIPFNDLFEGHYLKLDVWGNILLFIPLGIYLNLLKERKWYRQTLIGMAISILFEFLQYVFAIGASDITDVIYNTIGCVLGILAYHCLKLIFKKQSGVKTFIAIFSCIVAVMVSVIILLLFVFNNA